MATDVTRFGAETKSGRYMTCEIGGQWFFCPADPDWLAFNGNDSFSAPHASEQDAVQSAERWEAEND